MINEQLANQIVQEVSLLKQRYPEEDALLDLLKAEQSRLERAKKITLGHSPKELVQGAARFVGDLVKNNPVVSSQLFMHYVVKNVIIYLIDQGVIDQANASRETLIIALVVALIIDQLRKQQG